MAGCTAGVSVLSHWDSRDVRRLNAWRYYQQFHVYGGGKNPWTNWAQIFLEEDIRDVITCFKFSDDRFRGLASAEGQILPFPIDFDGRPYNTLTLPCEPVFNGIDWSVVSQR